jgi:hypothetical protein
VDVNLRREEKRKTKEILRNKMWTINRARYVGDVL